MESENQKSRAAQSGRLDPELLSRFLDLSERTLRVCEKLADDRRPDRIIGQLVGAGTSPGAQVHEAHSAMSNADFVKCLSIAAKELNECRYWLKLIARMEWIKPDQLRDLDDEALQLSKILHTIMIRTRTKK